MKTPDEVQRAIKRGEIIEDVTLDHHDFSGLDLAGGCLIGGSECRAARLIKIKPASPSRHAVQNVNTVAVL